MQTDKPRSSSTPTQGSAFRTLIMLGALLPAWHSMGMDFFDRMSSEVQAAMRRYSKLALLPYSSPPMDFEATAYCDSGITKAGVPAEFGIVAADPSVIPLGSWIRVECPPENRGLYQVMDTGRLIKGKMIDIYLPTLDEATRFGRQKVQMSLVKYGSSKRKPSLSCKFGFDRLEMVWSPGKY